MEPTYEDGETAICTRIVVGIQRGEVVVAWPEGENKLIIKRVIGIPGDTVTITAGGDVYVNGELSEYGVGNSSAYIFESSGMIFDEDGNASITLGKNEFWLMGDNRENSLDSRYWGAFNGWRILRRVLYTF